MTKNKKRKSALREISAANGVSMTRAALLNDRGRKISELDRILEQEKNLAWMLYPVLGYHHIVGNSIPVHCDSNSRDTLLWGSGVWNQKRGIPHYFFTRGTQEQRFRFLDNIRGQIDEMPGAYSEVLRKETVRNQISHLMDERNRRYQALEDNDVDYFGDLRVDSLKKQGIDKTHSEYPYLYVFVYDWDAVMADSPKSAGENLRSLIENGKAVGIHFIISTGGLEKEVTGKAAEIGMKHIYIRDAEGPDEIESAGLFCRKHWVHVMIPPATTPSYFHKERSQSERTYCDE